MGGPRPRYDRLGSLLEALCIRSVLSHITELFEECAAQCTAQYNYGVLITRNSRNKSNHIPYDTVVIYPPCDAQFSRRSLRFRSDRQQQMLKVHSHPVPLLTHTTHLEY